MDVEERLAVGRSEDGLKDALALRAQGEEKFLTTKEAAEPVRMSPRSLERMRPDGRGPRFCKLGETQYKKRGRVVYPRSEVIAWLDRMLR